MQQQQPSQEGLLEDVLAPRRENWTTFPTGDISSATGGLLFPSDFSFFDEDLTSTTPYSSYPSFLELITSSSSHLQPPALIQSPNYINNDEIYSSNYDHNTSPLLAPIQDFQDQEYPSSMVEDQHHHDPGHDDHNNNFDDDQQLITCNNSDHHDIHIPLPATSTVFNMGLTREERKTKSKKVEGQPSKNLMAERRRRKRLNDRLSMLRSIVPKISKMDRTSILGDTIDYMKELLEKIHNLKEQDMETDVVDKLNLAGSFNELNMTQVQVRNHPKFEVERRSIDMRIQICCSSKPGLLLSTVNTLEAPGLDIQQCVISCFNDFSLQASCSEAVEHRRVINSEDMRQVLIRNAGYPGRCL